MSTPFPHREESPPRDQPDEILLERVRAGDEEAANELVRRHHVAAYGVAWRILGNRADAEDAVQDGFANAFRKLKQFQGRSKFKTWFLPIVRNDTLKAVRHKVSQQKAEKMAATRRSSVEYMTPLDELKIKERRALIKRTIRKDLTLEMRRVYRLRIGKGMTYPKIALRLGMTLGTVRGVMNRITAILEMKLAYHSESLY